MSALPTQEGYDRWAQVYDSDGNPLLALEEPLVAELLGPVGGLDVADIGCGTGRHALRLAAARARVTALDFSEGMLQQAQAKPGAASVRFLQHDISQPLPLRTDAFDRVLNCLVIEHIGDLVGLFRELHRICRRKGFIVVTSMHPAMKLKGVQARYVDPSTGDRVLIESRQPEISECVTAAIEASLAIDHISEHAADEKLATRFPRAQRYVGWPMLFAMRLRPG